MSEELAAKFEKKDNITVKRNGKGEYAWDVKLYFDAATEDSDKILNKISDIENSLRSRFL